MIKKLPFRSIFFLLFILAFTGFVEAQFNETIRTGRPGQSINPFTTGKGVLQFQQGYVFDKSESKTEPNRLTFMNVLAENSTFENVIRYGIAERIEINAAIDYKWNYVKTDDSTFAVRQNYLNTLDIGGRMHISDQNAFWPNTALQVRLGMGQYFEGGDFEVKDVKVTGAFGWDLWENHGLTINLIPIINIDGIESSRMNYTLAYSWNFTDKWGVFIENYGTLYFDPIINNTFDTYLDGGFSYLVNNNVQLDVLGGYGSNQISDGTTQKSFFVGVGISWRILTAK